MFIINGRFLTQKPTGVHRYTFEMCNYLHQIGADFYVVAPKEINPDYKFDFKLVQFGDLKTHLWEQISLPRYLRKNGSPLLVSFSGCGPLNYKNQIMTIHDVSHERHPEWFSKNYCRYYGYMMPRIGRKAHAVITVSEFSKQEIIETLHLPKEKVHVVLGGAPLMPKFSDEEIINYKQDNSKEKYIISVSSMDPRKNFIRLVEAFNRIEDKSIKLYIIGMKFKAFNTPDLEKLEHENVIMPGYVDNDQLQQLYRDALFSVYPSLYEGFGIPPIEAMTCGCPVIASDIPAVREISGDAALYIDPYSIEDMTDKMNLLVKNEQLRKELIIKGLAKSKEYSFIESAKQAYELIKKYE